MRSARHFLIAACSVVSLCSCARYQPEPISPAVAGAALESRTLADPRLREFVSIGASLAGRPEPEASWDLDRLTLAAVYYHPDLDIARAKLASARAGVITAAQVPNPLLSIGGFYNSTVLAPSPWNVGAMVNFLIETFGKREDRIAQAGALADAARYDLATATWRVRGAVRTALLDLWAASERVRLMKDQLEYQDQLVGLLDQRLKAGQASSGEVTLQRISRNQTALTLSSTQEQVAQARVQLAAAIGVPVAALDGVNLSFAAFRKPVPIAAKVTNGYFRRIALTHRSDVEGLLAKYSAAQSALQLAVVNQFPNVSLGPGYTFDQGDNKYDLSIAADLPIFNQNQGPIAQASANRRAAAARFIALQAQIIGAIDSAVAGYRATTGTLRTADSLLASDRTHLREVSKSFSAGAVGHLSLLSAQVELATIEVSRFEATVKQRQAIGALEDALQRPLFDPGHWPPVLQHGQETIEMEHAI